MLSIKNSSMLMISEMFLLH